MSKSKDKGTKFETLMVRWFKEYGFTDARRKPLAGNKDEGDLEVGGIPLECKDVVKMSLGTWVKEANVEAVNANAPFCPVVHKRKGTRDPAKQYVTMEAGAYAQLLAGYEGYMRG